MRRLAPCPAPAALASIVALTAHELTTGPAAVGPRPAATFDTRPELDTGPP